MSIKNKINCIGLESYQYSVPAIIIYRGGYDFTEHHSYLMCSFNNHRNGRRFVRGVKMASELYRRQSSGHSQD